MNRWFPFATLYKALIAVSDLLMSGPASITEVLVFLQASQRLDQARRGFVLTGVDLRNISGIMENLLFKWLALPRPCTCRRKHAHD